MGGSSSHISWKSAEPEGALWNALATLKCEIQELPSQEWDPNTLTIGGMRDYQLCVFSPIGHGWSFLLLRLDSLLGEPLSEELSKTAHGPVIVFSEFDQYAWGFSLFQGGSRVGHFWNRPEVVEEEPMTCTVEPDAMAALLGVSAGTVAPYLQQLPPETEEADYAFADDEHPLSDHWVRCDLMRRLGMPYPNPGDPGTRHIFIQEQPLAIKPSR